MKNILFSIFAVFLFSAFVFAQKGVDTQSRKIHEESVKGTQITSNNGNTYDFGKDKTKTRSLLDNPYKLNSRRDRLIESVIDALKEKKITVDENSSRVSDGFIVTEPFVFSKGVVITQSELNHYAVVPNSDTVYSRARYILTIEVQSIDGIQNNVSVTAKIEGKSENGLRSEWTGLQSNGIAEDEFLVKLVEMVTGNVINQPIK